MIVSTYCAPFIKVAEAITALHCIKRRFNSDPIIVEFFVEYILHLERAAAHMFFNVWVVKGACGNLIKFNTFTLFGNSCFEGSCWHNDQLKRSMISRVFCFKVYVNKSRAFLNLITTAMKY